MIEKEKQLLKNKQISDTKKGTLERHANMCCKSFTVKIQENRLLNSQIEALEKIFIEQKWYKNYILNWNEQDLKNNKISKFNYKQNIITHKDKDFNDIEVEIKYLSASQRQCLISRMLANIKTLHSLKIKGYQNPGKLKYSKEETAIDFKQYGVTHKIVSINKVKLQGIPGKLKVNGLKQIFKLKNYEIANARLIHRATGYFIQLVVYIPFENISEKKKINKTVGIDFGCETAFTTSEGEKINVQIQESERLKRLSRRNNKRLIKAFNEKYGHNPDFSNLQDRSNFKKLSRSKNWKKENFKIKKEYQKMSNRKDDSSNKIVSNFKKYETVVIQDEQISKWQKSNHGKKIQHSVLGRVKTRLKQLDNLVVLDKFVPTTKCCTKCGKYHDELKVSDRIFKCDCGVEMDRDIHAAKNMIWFFENNVGVERTKLKRVEMEALIDEIVNQLQSTSSSKKHEDHTF